MDKNSIVENYIERLNSSKNSSIVLVSFCKEILNIDSKNLYPIMSRLVKIYGVDIMFMSILDCTDVPDINMKTFTGLLTYFAKKRVEKKFIVTSMQDLTKVSKENISRMVE